MKSKWNSKETHFTVFTLDRCQQGEIVQLMLNLLLSFQQQQPQKLNEQNQTKNGNKHTDLSRPDQIHPEFQTHFH